MNKLGSEFFKAIDQFERGIIGSFTWRQILMFVGIVLGLDLRQLSHCYSCQAFSFTSR